MGPTEVLAHGLEMLQFWLGEIERVPDAAPEPVPFGRTVADRVRVPTIEATGRARHAKLDRIGATVERYARRSRTSTARTSPGAASIPRSASSTSAGS
jgi:hypothetical protein